MRKFQNARGDYVSPIDRNMDDPSTSAEVRILAKEEAYRYANDLVARVERTRSNPKAVIRMVILALSEYIGESQQNREEQITQQVNEDGSLK
jgi:hypothetical protein